MKNVFNFLYKTVLPVYISGQLARQNTLQLLVRSAGLGLKTLSGNLMRDFWVSWWPLISPVNPTPLPLVKVRFAVGSGSELRPQEPACA